LHLCIRFPAYRCAGEGKRFVGKYRFVTVVAVFGGGQATVIVGVVDGGNGGSVAVAGI
jgi:hypothetical protein